MKYTTLLTSPIFFELLLKIDIIIAKETCDGGCFFCEGLLHVSNWIRAGFGIPDGCSKDVLIRHSFTCNSCKKRCTPNSLRFMYYRWYTTGVELVVAALRPNDDKEAQNKLRKDLGISEATMTIFLKWWQDTFCNSTFEKQTPLAIASNSTRLAPSAILKHFEDQYTSLKKILESAVKFLSRYRTERLWALFKARTAQDRSPPSCSYSPFSMG